MFSRHVRLGNLVLINSLLVLAFISVWLYSSKYGNYQAFVLSFSGMKFKQIQTPLLEVRKLRDRFKLPGLYIKDESEQTHGTWKDRRSKLIIERALSEGVTTLVLITSGNAGYSLAKLAQGTGLKVVLVVDWRISPVLKNKLRDVCFRLVEQDLSSHFFTSKELISFTQLDPRETIWDVTNGFTEAYESVITELKSSSPDYIICPVGSGEGFIGLSNGIKKHRLRTRLIGVTPSAQESVADKLTARWTPYADMIVSSGNILLRISEEVIEDAHSLATEHLSCEPSSAIVFASLKSLKFEKDERMVSRNTGNGSK